MTRALARDLAALLLVALGLGANVAAGGLDPRTLALAAATVLAWGTSGAWGPGLLAFLVGIAAHPYDMQPIFPTLTNVTALVAGAGLGLIVRHLAVHRWQGPLNRDTIRALVALALGGTFLMSPSMARLAASDGAPLLLGLEVVDPTNLVAATVERHVALAMPHPLSPVAPFLATLCLGASWVGLARVGSAATRRRLWIVVAVFALVAVVVGAVPPLLETFQLDTDHVRETLSFRGAARGAVIAVAPAEATFAPWSRPPVDALRLLFATALLSLTLDRTPDRPRPELDLRSLLVAISLLVLAFGLGGFMPEAVAGGALILGAAAVAVRGSRAEPDPGPRGSVPAGPHIAALIALFLLFLAVALAPIQS
jgi:hypothetical protein